MENTEQLVENPAVAEQPAEEPETAGLPQALAEREAALEQLAENLVETVAAYRKAAAALNTDVPEEMITGDTVADVDDSVARGRALVEKVKAGIKVPAPPPTVSSPRGAVSEPLSAAAKIRRGLGF